MDRFINGEEITAFGNFSMRDVETGPIEKFTAAFVHALEQASSVASSDIPYFLRMVAQRRAEMGPALEQQIKEAVSQRLAALLNNSMPNYGIILQLGSIMKAFAMPLDEAQSSSIQHHLERDQSLVLYDAFYELDSSLTIDKEKIGRGYSAGLLKWLENYSRGVHVSIAEEASKVEYMTLVRKHQIPVELHLNTPDIEKLMRGEGKTEEAVSGLHQWLQSKFLESHATDKITKLDLYELRQYPQIKEAHEIFQFLAHCKVDINNDLLLVGMFMRLASSNRRDDLLKLMEIAQQEAALQDHVAGSLRLTALAFRQQGDEAKARMIEEIAQEQEIKLA